MKKDWIAKVVLQKDVADDTKEVTFEFLEPGFNFKAGQYVWIILSELHYEDPKGNRRAFSICSSPSQGNSISIVFRNNPSGYKKTLTELPVGSEVQVSGPFGHLDFPDDPATSVVFIAGGVGVAPFMSMIRTASERKYLGKITLLYANTNVGKAAYSDELAKLSSENKNFMFMQKTGSIDWSFISGSVTDPKQVVWYLIGPEKMVRSVAKLLYENNIEETDIKFEEFYVSRESLNTSIGEILNTVEVFKLAAENAFDHIILTDINGTIVFANTGAEKITGYTKSEMVGQTPRLWGGLMDKESYQIMWHRIKTEKKPFEGEITNRRKNGETYQTITRISPVLDNNKNLVGFLGTEEDISLRLKFEVEIKKKVAELERTNNLMIGRELKMRELKEQIRKLQADNKKRID